MSEGARPPRIAVTGIGAVSGFGWGVEALERGLRGGRTAIGKFDCFDHTGHRTHVASQVPGPDPDPPLHGAAARRISRADGFALAAAQEAVRAAGLTLPAPSPREFGVYFGSSTGGMLEAETFFEELRGWTKGRFRASRLISHQNNCPADAVARHLGLCGPVETISSACASSAMAIGAALDALRAGEVEVALAGGADSLCRLTYAGFNALRAVDAEPCRPFRADRAGLSLGEGAAVLVLETVEHARARGQRPDVELRGAGSSCDAFHMTAPHPEGAGAARAVEEALRDAGLDASAIDFVNAHGTGTRHNDVSEWYALRVVLGERAATVPVTSTKGFVGHLLGSAGALEAVATILCLRRGEVHATPGGSDVDPEIPVDLVRAGPRALASARVALSTSLGFGGANAALILAASEPA